MLQPQIIPFNGLRGINTKKSVTQRAPNEADAALTGYFDKTGAFIKARGFRRINDVEIGTNIEINSIYQFNRQMIVAGGTDLISYDLDSEVETVLDGSVAGAFYDFEEFLPYQTNYLIGTNGNDPPFKFNGLVLSNLSITRPATTPTATASAAGGSLTPSSTYQLAVRFLRDNGSGEQQTSNPSDTVTVTLGVGDNRIALTAVPVSTDPQVTGREIYLSRPNGAILFLQGTITDNVATPYNITTNVDVLENPELEYDHDPAPQCYLIEKYRNCLVMAGDPDFPQRFYFSKEGNVWYWPQGELDESIINYFDIGENITSIKAYYDYVFVFGLKGNIFVFQGSQATGYTLNQVKNDERVTALSDRATLVQDNWCYFLSYDGYYRTNAQIIEKMSDPISAYFDPENQQDAQYNVSGFEYGFNRVVPVAIYYKPNNQILLWITQAGQLSYVNNICFALHLTNIIVEGEETTPNYSIYLNRATRCTSIYIAENVAKYFLVAQQEGFVFEAERGRYDGAAVNSFATSATSTTLTDSTQTWTVNAFAQLWVTIRKGTGAGQARLIVSNTATALTVDHAWSQTPDASSEYSVGGIWWLYTHSYNSYGNDSLSKRLIYIRPRFVSEGDATVDISFGYDFADMDNSDIDTTQVQVTGSSEWDVALWDVAKWDGPTVEDDLIHGTASRIHRWASVQVANFFADQSVEYDGHDKIFQMKGVR